MEPYRPRRKDLPPVPPSLLPRPNNRAATALLPTYLRTGVVHGAAGSAYLEQDHTKLVCAVYGPRWSRRMEYSETGQFACDLKYAPTAQHKRRKRVQADDEKVASQALTQALTPAIRLSQYPKSYIEAYVVVLEDDGGVLPAAMTAVSLALADAQVEMFDLLAAASAHIIAAPATSPSHHSILLDCTATEQQHPTHTASLTLAYLPATHSYPHLQMHGTLPATSDDSDWCDTLLAAAVAGCEQLVASMRVALRDGMVRKVKETEAKEALDRELADSSTAVKVDNGAPV